jgi:hypothetical protein
LELIFPGKNSDPATIGILHGTNGRYDFYEPVRDEEGNYRVTVDSLSAFGMVRTADPALQAGTEAEADGGQTETRDGWSMLIVLLIALAGGAVVCALIIRTNKRKRSLG